MCPTYTISSNDVPLTRTDLVHEACVHFDQFFNKENYLCEYWVTRRSPIVDTAESIESSATIPTPIDDERICRRLARECANLAIETENMSGGIVAQFAPRNMQQDDFPHVLKVNINLQG